MDSINRRGFFGTLFAGVIAVYWPKSKESLCPVCYMPFGQCVPVTSERTEEFIKSMSPSNPVSNRSSSLDSQR